MKSTSVRRHFTSSRKAHPVGISIEPCSSVSSRRRSETVSQRAGSPSAHTRIWTTALGLIAGLCSASAGDYKFMLFSDMMKQASSPSSDPSAASCINDAGVIGADRPFEGRSLILTGTKWTTFAPGGINGLNSSGVSVGLFQDLIAGNKGWRRSAGGSVSYPLFPGSTTTTPRGINDQGSIVGSFSAAGKTHGFVLEGSTFTQVDYPGAALTRLYGIDAGGEAIGTYAVPPPGVPRAFLRDKNGNLSALDIPGSVQSQGLAISSDGKSAGDYRTAAGRILGFIYAGGNVTTIDASGALPLTVEAQGKQYSLDPTTTSTSVKSINSRGDLVGSIGATYRDTSGSTLGFSDAFVGRLTKLDAESMRVKGNIVTFSWISAAGWKESVQYKNSVGDPEWKNLPNPVSTQGVTRSVTDSTVGSPQRLYRLNVD